MKTGNARRLATLAAATGLLAACAQQPAPPAPTWQSQTGATLPIPLPVSVVTGRETSERPATPERISAGGAVARTLGAGLGAGLLGLGYGAIVGLPGGPFGMVALAGAGAAVGLVGGLVAGGIQAGRAVHSDAEAASAAVILLRQLDPARAATCLRDTLVSRSAGRMVAADASTDARLMLSLEELSLNTEAIATDDGGTPGRKFMPDDPPMQFHLHLHAPPLRRPEQRAATYGTGEWPWTGPGKRYFDWAAREGAAVQEQLEIGIGILAQKILADLYPSDFQPPPRQGAESLRTRCPGPPPQPASPVLIRVTGAAEAAPVR